MRADTEILKTARVFALPLHHRFRGITVREGIVFEGPAGWAEFAPFRDYDDQESVPWLRAALASATDPFPVPVRAFVEINTTVPVVGAELAAELVAASGCRTAKVKVADPRVDLTADAARVAAVRAVIGPTGRIRVDANAAWTPAQAVEAIKRLNEAAGGLEYVEQPCASLADMAHVRSKVEVPIAADESIRHAEDPLRVAVAGAADIAVLKVAPLGGIAAALRISAAVGLPVVVSSAVDSAIGIAAGLALAGALPALDFACGLGTASLLRADLSSRSPIPQDGRLAVPSRAPEPDRLAEFAADRDTTQFWLSRLARVAALIP